MDRSAAFFEKKFFEKIRNIVLTNRISCANISESLRDSDSYGRVVELVDSLDSGSSVHCGRAGSSPASPTK